MGALDSFLETTLFLDSLVLPGPDREQLTESCRAPPSPRG